MNAVHSRTPLSGRAIAFLILLAGSIAAFVPWQPTFPVNKLDQSWQYALNEAVAQQLRFGTDIVFTFGPYVSICWPQFHPATYSLMMFGSAYLALAFAAGTALLLRERKITAALLLVLLLALDLNRDAFQFVLPVLMVMVFARFLAPGRAGPAAAGGDPPRWTILATCGLLVSAVALLPLAKGTLALTSTALVIVAAGLAGIRRPVRGAGVLLCYALSMCLFWLCAGQRLSDLPTFLFSLGTVVSGYTDAMSLFGDVSRILWFVFICAAYLCLFVKSPLLPHDRRLRIVVLLALAWTFFVVFKAAFVRHDSHERIAFDFLVLAGGLLAAFSAGLVRISGVVIATLIVVGLGKSGNPLVIAYRLVQTCQHQWEGLQQTLRDPASLRDRFEAARERIRTDNPLASTAGPTDIYSYDQAVLLAHGFDWSPRPILQSYATYTPDAARLNAAHLGGAKAPQTLFFRVQTIDERLPALDDGYSWRELLKYYEPTTLEGHYIRLQRRTVPLELKSEMLVAGRRVLGEEVALPSDAGLLWAELDVRPTLLGRLVSVVYKLPRLRIAVTRADGAVAELRYIASMGRAGFLLQPLVAGTPDFLVLWQEVATGRHVGGIDIRSMRVYGEAGSEWFWRSDYTLSLSEIGAAPRRKDG